MELVVVVGFGNFDHKLVELGDGPAVQREHLLGLDQIVRVKAVEIAQAVPGGIAELQIVLTQLLEDFPGAAHVHMIVGGTGPEADHVRAELIDDVRRINAIAQGLVHGLTLAVNSPAMGQTLFIGSAFAQCADSNQQRGLEPAAILVAALHVHVRRPEALVALHGGVMGGAGIKPAVQRVGLLGEVDSAAVGALERLGQNILRLQLKPGVAAPLLEKGGHGFDGLLGADGLVAVLAVEHGDGQAPAALTGDAPVIALTDHGAHAVLAPGRQPAHVLTGLYGGLLKGVHGAEPLGSGAEDDGALAAPAVGVAVDDLLGGKEGAALFHVLKNDRVGLVCAHAGVFAGIVGVAALIIHGDDHVHAVAQAGEVVVGTETGSGMDTASAGIHGDVIRKEQAGGLIKEGMLCQHVFVKAAGMRLKDLIAVKSADTHDLPGQGLGHDVHFAVGGFHDGIGLVRMQGNGQVSRKGPDRSGPDDEVQAAQIQVGKLAQIVAHGEFNINGGTGIVLIFDLGLGQRRLVLGAPVHRLQALVNVPVLVHFAENTDFVRLKAFIHGLIGVLPVADNAKALEAVHLALDVLFCVVLAGGAKISHGHGLVVKLLLFYNGALYGHAVVIPAGDIRGVVPSHGIGTDNKVFNRFIEGMAHMNVAVGKGRAVMKGKAGLALIFFQQLIVDIHLFPVLKHFRLTLGQAGPHRELGLRQVQGGVEIL